MTIQDFLDQLDNLTWPLLIFFLALPLVAWLSSRSKPILTPMRRYWLSSLIYLASVPGVAALMIAAYSLFFLNRNLLEINVVTQILPIVSMAVTLSIMARAVDLERLPGFKRLSGLIMALVTTFLVVLIISKTRIWLVFASSIWVFLGLGLVLFLVIKEGFNRGFK